MTTGMQSYTDYSRKVKYKAKLKDRSPCSSQLIRGEIKDIGYFNDKIHI